MNAWGLFNWIYTSFNGPFLAAVNAMAADLAGAAEIPAGLLAAVYLATSFAMDQLTGGSGNPILDLARRCGRVALILGCLGAATYTGTISVFLLTTMPNDLTTAIAGNGAPVAAAAFDTLAGSVWAAGAQMLGSISAFDVGDYVVMGLGVILCDGLCLIGLGIAFTLWIVTAVSLGLLVAIGPLALLCLILPQTSRFFSGWLSGIVTAIVAQFLYTALIALLIATVQTLLVHILATNGSTGANANKVADQLHLLFGAGGIFLIAGFVSLAIVPLARLIGGGAAAETAAISRWAHGQLGAGARAAGGAVAGAAAAVTLGLSKNGAAGMRSITPVGKAVG